MSPIRTTLTVCFSTFALVISSPAWASKELDIARDGSLDAASTAVITKKLGLKLSMRPVATRLLHIVDFSLPPEQQEPVKLSGVWSDKYPRVSPGAYAVHISCEVGGNVYISTSHELTIEAKPGKAYVIECKSIRPKLAQSMFAKSSRRNYHASCCAPDLGYFFTEYGRCDGA